MANPAEASEIVVRIKLERAEPSAHSLLRLSQKQETETQRVMDEGVANTIGERVLIGLPSADPVPEQRALVTSFAASNPIVG